MFKKLIWFSILSIAVAGVLVLSPFFYMALDITSGGVASGAGRDNIQKHNPEKIVEKDPAKLRITILGDSIARGTGDEKGNDKKQIGFSAYLPASLQGFTPKDIVQENYGEDGLLSNELLKAMQTDKWNSLISASDLIVLSIGGNDLRTLYDLQEYEKEEQFQTALDNYLKNLQEILSIIRTNNADAYIVLVGLYNPSVELATPMDIELINTWNFNTQIQAENDAKTIFIPTYDLFRFSTDKFVSTDGLHPNSEGYQAISYRISRSLQSLFRES